VAASAEAALAAAEEAKVTVKEAANRMEARLTDEAAFREEVEIRLDESRAFVARVEARLSAADTRAEKLAVLEGKVEALERIKANKVEAVTEERLSEAKQENMSALQESLAEERTWAAQKLEEKADAAALEMLERRVGQRITQAESQLARGVKQIGERFGAALAKKADKETLEEVMCRIDELARQIRSYAPETSSATYKRRMDAADEDATYCITCDQQVLGTSTEHTLKAGRGRALPSPPERFHNTFGGLQALDMHGAAHNAQLAKRSLERKQRGKSAGRPSTARSASAAALAEVATAMSSAPLLRPSTAADFTRHLRRSPSPAMSTPPPAPLPNARKSPPPLQAGELLFDPPKGIAR